MITNVGRGERKEEREFVVVVIFHNVKKNIKEQDGGYCVFFRRRSVYFCLFYTIIITCISYSLPF